MFLPGGKLSQDNHSPDAPVSPLSVTRLANWPTMASVLLLWYILCHLDLGYELQLKIKYFLSLGLSQLFYYKFRVQPKSDHLKYLIVFL